MPLDALLFVACAPAMAALGTWLLLRRGAAPWQRPVGLHLVVNAALALWSAADLLADRRLLEDALHERLMDAADVATASLILAVALTLDRPLLRPRWAGLLCSAVALGYPAALLLGLPADYGSRPEEPFRALGVLYGALLPAAAWGLFFVRGTQWLLRTDGRLPALVFSAYALRGVHVAILVPLLGLSRLGPAAQPAFLRVVLPLQLALLALAAACTVVLAVHAVRRRSAPVRWAVLALCAGAAATIVSIRPGLAYDFRVSPLVNWDLFVLRPALLWLALGRPALLPAGARWTVRGLEGVVVGAALAACLDAVLPPELPPTLRASLVAIVGAAGLAALLLVLARLQGPVPARRLVPGLRVRGVRLARPLGEDGKAWLGDLAGRPVVLKRCAPEELAAERLRARLAHDHVLPLLAARRRPFPHIVVPYVEAGGVEAWLAARRPSLARRTAAAAQLAEGLAAVHAAGLVHGDLKPANVLVEEGTEPRVLLADFGCAARAEDAAWGGSRRHWAPERFDGAPPSQAADAYAAGLLAAHLLAGRRPLPDGLTPDEEAARLRAGLVPALPAAVPRRAAAAVRAALDPAPGRRPSAAALAAALREPKKQQAAADVQRVPVRHGGRHARS